MYRIGGIPFSDSRLVYIVGLMVLAIIVGLALSNQLGQATAGPSQSAQVIKAASVNTPSPVAASGSSAAADDSFNDSSQNNTRTTLNVNGQNIPVPENGSVNQSIESADGSTQVNVDSQHSTASTGQAGNTTHSSVNINVRSHSNSSVSSEESGL